MRAALAVSAAAALIAGCSSEYPGFNNANPTVAPRATASLVFSGNSYATFGGAPHEVFAVEDGGGGLTRLTYCSEFRRCDTGEAAPASDRNRIAVRRVQDVDADGRLTAADGEALLMLDLVRSEEATLVPAAARVSGVDWSPVGELLVYSATAAGDQEDLFQISSNGQNQGNLTATTQVRERRPRFAPAGNAAAFERIDTTGKGQIYILNQNGSVTPVTTGGSGSDPLAGTPYVVGSDADPDYSPDGGSLVFRRLVGLGNGTLGRWDVLTVRTDGTGLSTVASGGAFRGAPDWGAQGIVFAESDGTGTPARLVVVQPDGSGRRTPVALGAGFDLTNPRWLR